LFIVRDCSSGFVEEFYNCETSIDGRLEGGITLGLFEVSGDGDDGTVNVTTKEFHGSSFDFGEWLRQPVLGGRHVWMS